LLRIRAHKFAWKGSSAEERQLLRYRQALNKLDLLVLDELGYVPASKAGAELLFDVIATAYERDSLIVTTNLPFENWTEVLGSERLTGAALDRLTHRCPQRNNTAGDQGRKLPPPRRQTSPQRDLISTFRFKLPPARCRSQSQAHPEPILYDPPIPRAAIFPRKAPPFSTGLNSRHES